LLKISANRLILAKNNTLEKNVLGTQLQACCYEPKTVFYRDGFCITGPEDVGTHVVCAIMTEEFLTYTKMQGNDLSTPRLEWQFPGLKAGDKWCLCVSRWLEAKNAGVAPKVDLKATHIKALEFASLELLEAYAI
jgi:uncharacterized protein (DUF2237 family)